MSSDQIIRPVTVRTYSTSSCPSEHVHAIERMNQQRMRRPQESSDLYVGPLRLIKPDVYGWVNSPRDTSLDSYPLAEIEWTLWTIRESPRSVVIVAASAVDARCVARMAGVAPLPTIDKFEQFEHQHVDYLCVLWTGATCDVPATRLCAQGPAVYYRA